MSLSPVFAKPVDMIGSMMVKADLATESEVSSLKAIAGYAKRDGFLGSIATLLHRVWNAVKAVFGQSDWQRARNAVISVTERFATKFATQAKDEQEAAEFLNAMRSKEGHKKIDEVFAKLVEGINQMNQKVKPYETFLVPVVDQLLAAVDQERIVADFQEAPEATLDFFFDAENMNPLALVQRGYVKPEIAEVLGNMQQNKLFAQAFEQ